MVGLTNEMSHFVHDKGHNPCQCRSIESGKDGPFPTAGLLLDGGKGGYAGEIDEHKQHVGQCDNGSDGDAGGEVDAIQSSSLV